MVLENPAPNNNIEQQQDAEYIPMLELQTTTNSTQDLKQVTERLTYNNAMLVQLIRDLASVVNSDFVTEYCEDYISDFGRGEKSEFEFAVTFTIAKKEITESTILNVGDEICINVTVKFDGVVIVSELSKNTDIFYDRSGSIDATFPIERTIEKELLYDYGSSNSGIYHIAYYIQLFTKEKQHHIIKTFTVKG